MSLKAGLTCRKVNHSARKTTVTSLLHSNVKATQIMQMTGHCNVQSINQYSSASLEQQEKMSNILSDISSGNRGSITNKHENISNQPSTSTHNIEQLTDDDLTNVDVDAMVACIESYEENSATMATSNNTQPTVIDLAPIMPNSRVCVLPYSKITCKYPYFGDSCLQQCDCEHGVCDHVTGKCDCSVGWTGTKCNIACENGYFGNNCQQVCSCENGNCDHMTGNCACYTGWTGGNCRKPCANGYFGNNCQQECSCENGNCDHITGNCACYTGWTGRNCRKPCANGYFGNNCQQECSCENGNCDHITGNCACYTGWTGRNCRKPCDHQYFGDDCQEKCECENGICNHVTGNCTCQPGWTGKTCNDTCKHGYFGVGCLEKCTCQDGYCDNESGNCTCEVGWNGLTCEEKIPNSHYGTLFTSTSGGFVGFILMLICLSIISIKLRRGMKQTTTRNTATAPTHTEDVTPHYEYIDIENSNIDNEQTMEQYESLRSSDSYEEMSNYDIIITQSAGCENTININLHQYEPLRGSKKRSHIYSDTRPNDDPVYLEVLG
ncbi:Protein draper,Cell death abnormality protein 1,Platelet endothelial aggregation receptor 1,Multiple epidermal growth factor-like domains protein 11,Multiple epidermal growth factor-like domains protein 10,Multiple epidermal growth factor-like domains protein 6 [Mytilus coruscus]|uniref:MEGF10_11 n=1 Tax=Mytilus coruscus TaxID=42192 RepID=A0A6J8AZM2_MYTCO|nr:Protein draper,Cell death abnormality protein 1,Platelet endothelial aggregation receptor 1,Multiple epidermal growth factor-like domains protein 11,Multiple epidermal growth factor-like domains protein 10,Multiple epidermal growth factor-like domains protein 6 [Mytilus coruscus]